VTNEIRTIFLDDLKKIQRSLTPMSSTEERVYAYRLCESLINPITESGDMNNEAKP
jgi:hypothetical protein